MNLISKQALADEIGVKVSVINSWQKLYWQRGVHYVVVGKTTLLKRDEAEKWLNEGFRQDSPKEVTPSESRSWSKDEPSPKPSKEKVTKLTSPLQ